MRMPISTPTKLANLRKFLAKKTNTEVLRLYLHQNHDNLLKAAFLVTLHRTWSSRPPYMLTDIGITTYDRRTVKCGTPCPPGAHAENHLQHVWSMNLCLKSKVQPAQPKVDNDETFHFGTTVHVSTEEALNMLHQIWQQDVDDKRPEQGLRPIICLSYGDNEGLATTRREAFEFIPSNLLTTVATLDGQSIAVQSKITSRPDAPLEYVLPILKIVPFGLGSGGNAAMYCTIMAFLAVLRAEVYGDEENPRAKPGRTGASKEKSAQSVVQWLMERPTPAPPF